MQRLILLSLMCFSVLCTAENNLQRDMEKLLAEEALAGVAWALLNSDGSESLGAAGLQDNFENVPFDRNTRFHVGSITKSLLATGVLRLVTIGQLDLDAPVSRYLPDLPFENPWQAESPVTVRHLLDHTSGLDDARLWQMFSERAQPDTPLLEAFPASLLPLEIRARPGSRFSYSNSGYALLGLLIEAVVKTRYESYLDAQLLIPLGMSNSTFSFTTQVGDAADPTLAWGHVDDGSRYSARPVFLRPAAQFTTTSSDLIRFAKFLLGDGIVDGQVFINAALMHSRGLPSTTDSASHGLEAGYALGLGRRDRHGVVGLCHGGNILGFRAMLCVFPNDNKAMVYSVNTDSETADYGRVTSLLIRELDVTIASVPPSSEVAVNISDWYGRYVLRPNRFATFDYLDTIFGAINISARGGSTVMTLLQNPDRILGSVNGNLFSANDRATASHVFYQDDEAVHLLSDGFNTYEKVNAGWLFAHWASMILGLLGLAILLIAGLVMLLRQRVKFLRTYSAPAFFSVVALCLPVPFFFGQSFMALGDVTLASALLAVVTFLMPVGVIITAWRAWRAWQTRQSSVLALVHSVAAIMLLQWCFVLAAAGLLPLRLRM